jgi:hypothetical protein
MDPSVSSSSTAEKTRVLPFIFNNGPIPWLVIAIGTAAFPDGGTLNGCVTLGTNCFIFNPYASKPNPNSNWTSPQIGKLVTTNAAPFLGSLDQDLRAQVESRFLSAVLSPAKPPILAISADFLALSSVNVTDYSAYEWVDPAAIAAVQQASVPNPIGSVETTHAVIRVQSDAPFLFVSGIANRVGKYALDAAPRDYAQNFVASHNAGVALAWLITLLL